MSDIDQPAENTGGGTAAPASVLPESLPERLRVHALAKLLGTTSREVLTVLTSLGETPRSVQSSVSRELARQVAESLSDAGGGGAAAAEAPDGAVAAELPAETVPAESQQARPSTPAWSAPEESHQTSVGAATRSSASPVFAAASPPVFLPPSEFESAPASGGRKSEAAGEQGAGDESDRAPWQTGDTPARDSVSQDETSFGDDDDDDDDESDSGGGRRRRRRGRRGRGRGKGGADEQQDDAQQDSPEQAVSAADSQQHGDHGDSGDDSRSGDDESGEEAETDAGEGTSGGGSRRRRRRRRRKDSGESAGSSNGQGSPNGSGSSNGQGSSKGEVDPPNTVTHVRDGREHATEAGPEQVRSVRGSTRLEAKRQRRRDGRESGRKRAPVVSEAEFLARRESVRRTMVVREREEHVQIGVLEDGVLAEHFVTSHVTGSLVGNVYLGRVQNVLPSMEAAFVDIGRGRNAVLYAGEVDWDAAGLEGKARKIEQALSTGDSILVQVTKDPVGHKGARLTTQISLPGRFLVYVPGGGATGISRKLPDTERKRLKEVLKRIVPSDAGVIVRTASEGIGEDELDGDVRRLQAQWEAISERSKSGRTKAPELLYAEPDLLIKVVRDMFTEDFSELVVAGEKSYETIEKYVNDVAPDLADRLKRHVGTNDVFTEHRIDEQIAKALDRKVWLPSGGTLVIDRTEAMTVIDVNTGKFTGSGGNLEETVTKNNLESAEEIVRQLRLRDIGGIIVIDFIDMVLESNRDLVLRRLTECLGRDRTRHQVAEVTSLGLVQMTRKRIGTGLLEAFSTSCEHCKGRGVVVSTEPHTGTAAVGNGNGNGGSRKGRNRSRGDNGDGPGGKHQSGKKDVAQQEPSLQEASKQDDEESAAAKAQRIAAASLIHSKAAEQAGTSGGGGEDTAAAVPASAAAETNGTGARQAEPGSATGNEQQAPAVEDGGGQQPVRRRRRRAVSRPAGPPGSGSDAGQETPV